MTTPVATSQGRGALTPMAEGRAAAGAAADWWDPNNVGLSAIAAYRAINSVGTPWSGGPGNYAASRVNQVSPGVNDLIEGNGAIPWVQATGWGFVAAAVQYFDTALIPAADQSWSMFVQFAGGVLIVGAALAGERDGNARDRFRVFPNGIAGNVVYGNGGGIVVPPNLAAGNLGIAGNQGYRNGIADGGVIAVWDFPTTRSIYIGAQNNQGVAAGFVTHDIESVAIYNGGAAAVQAEALAIVTAQTQL